jgi:O-antigen ligase
VSVSTIGYQNSLDWATVSKATGGVAAALGVVAVLAEGRRARLRDSHFLAIAFGLWMCLSIFWTIDVSLTVAAILAVVLQVALVLLAAEFTPGRDGSLNLATAFVAGTAVPIVQIVFLGITGAQVFVDDRLHLGNTNPNDLAFLFAIGIPLSWWVGYTRRRWWLVAASVYVPLALYCIVLTASRAGFIVALIGASIVPWSLLAGRPRRAAAAGVIALLLTPAVGIVLPVEQITRLATTADSLEQDGLNGRVVLWGTAWQIIGEHPLVGVGGGASRTAIGEETASFEGAHNTLLSVTSDVGAVGLLLFLGLWLSVLVPAVRARHRFDRRVAIILGLVLVIGLQSRHWEYEKGTWLALSILVGMAGPAGRLPRAGQTAPAAVEQRIH